VNAEPTPTGADAASIIDRFRLDGRVAVVTGSGRGIGRGIALGLAAAGADVVVTARRTAEVDAVTAEVRALGRRAIGVLADITDDDAIPMLVDRAVADLGRLDVWVSNAGGSEHKGHYATLEMPDEHWDAQFALNLRPHFRAAKACAAVMDPGSSIIGISSTSSLGPSLRFAAYGAAKAGMNQLTSTLALDLAPLGVRANSIAVGIVPTESLRTIGGIEEEAIAKMARSVPLGRLGDPMDVAAAVVYLSSPAASWVTGQTIAVNGGR
jgi:NAD(P)-dependent dehydrogenase (short-subunit alcohol dehydrogenase family)